MRVGQDYDTHRLVEGRKFMLGGAGIPYEEGLLGHNDADVLLHAISGVLLGAAALGDIGAYSPGSDPAYSGADSTELLRAIGNLIRAAGYEVGSVDSTVVCQAPKLTSHIGVVHTRTAEVLAFPMGTVNVKANSEEHMRFTGRGGGTAAHAVCPSTERAK